MPDSIAEAIDYDEKTKARTPAVDKITGKRVFQCRVADMDPELEGRSGKRWSRYWPTGHPSPPTGQPFELIEFDNLTVTPYVTDKGKLAYSLKATAIKPARPAASKDAA